MTSWADKYVDVLKTGKSVEFRPSGHSMEPIIKMGELVTLEPVKHGSTYNGIDVTKVVLVTTDIGTFLHRVSSICDIGSARWYHIEGIKGKSNGWVTEDKIFGYVSGVTP